MNSLDYWRQVAGRLAVGESVFVALVVDHTRGSPGTRGARALVDSHGRMQGTVGGGIMEANILEQAREALAQTSYTPCIRRLVHRRNAGAEASGLICAGEQTNLYAVLRPQRDAESVARFVNALEHEDTTTATLSIDGQGLDIVDALSDTTQPPSGLRGYDDDWCYSEQNISQRRLVIVGGGHCGQALAALAATVGDRVDIFDTRAEIIDTGEWPRDAGCHTLIDYQELASRLTHAAHTRVVVMTTAVTHDIAALAALGSQSWQWIGVMGSRQKIRTIHSALRDRGMAKASIDAIRGPIGLSMKSDTPAEIAVSIMGELLSHEQT